MFKKMPYHYNVRHTNVLSRIIGLQILHKFKTFTVNLHDFSDILNLFRRASITDLKSGFFCVCSSSFLVVSCSASMVWLDTYGILLDHHLLHHFVGCKIQVFCLCWLQNIRHM